MAPQFINSVLVPCATRDLTDLNTVKDELDIDDVKYDDLLSRWITTASTVAQNYCNRTFAVQTYNETIWPQRDPFPRLILGGLMPLQLKNWPLIRSAIEGISAPPAPSLSSVSGGSLGDTTYYIVVTYVTAEGESAASAENLLDVSTDHLLQVASPAIDAGNLATGWNVYVATASGAETLQNASPVAIGTAWTEPAGGLVSGAGIPSITVTENDTLLVEGTDYTSDLEKGQLQRLDRHAYPRKWMAFPILVQYQAGYAEIPPDVADAVVLLVKHRWFARSRDPYLRSENIEGVYSAQYWIAQGPGSSGSLPPDVEDMLNNYRVPVVS